MKYCAMIFGACACLAAFFVTPSPAAEKAENVVWLDFDYQLQDVTWPNDEKRMGQARPDQRYLGSAFLREIKRQTLLLTARDELGAITRDAFLGEVAPEGAVKIELARKLFHYKDDFDTTSRNIDYRELLTQWEAYSRNEFVEAWKSAGVKKTPPPKANVDAETEKLEETQINELLRHYALVPNFEAIRRIHEKIRTEGETLSRLKLLVRAYTQMQILTNAMPRDTHRVFQARAVLYAQRAVAKYGNENPETLALRAATWSYCNFHRVARNDFTGIIKGDAAEHDNAEHFSDPWIRMAFRYANFDLNGIELEYKTLSKEERPFAGLLLFILISYTAEDKMLPPESHKMLEPYAEELIAELSRCERLFHEDIPSCLLRRLSNANISRFNERFNRYFPEQVQKMHCCPESVTKSAAELQSVVPPEDAFNTGSVEKTQKVLAIWKEVFPKIGNFIQSMRDTTLHDDPGELSFQALATILEDAEFTLVRKQFRRLFFPEEALDELILMSEKGIGAHPLYPFLVFSCRKEENKNRSREFFKAMYPDAKAPLNMFSQTSLNINRYIDAMPAGCEFATHACCFTDRENVRDVIFHQILRHRTFAEIGSSPAAWIFELCPNNPYVLVLELHQKKEFDEALVDRMLSTYSGIGYVVREVFTLSARHNRLDKMESIFKSNPDSSSAFALATRYIAQNNLDKAIETLKFALELSPAYNRYFHAECAKQLGLIYTDMGKMEEAKPWLVKAADAMAGADGYPNFQMPLAFCYEINDEFEKAQELARDFFEKSNGTPFPWFALCYRTEHPNLVLALEKMIEQYSIKRENERIRNGVDYNTMLYTLYLMDASMDQYVDFVGEEPLVTSFFETKNYISGVLAYFDAMENGDKAQAEFWLKLLLYGEWDSQVREEVAKMKNRINKPIHTGHRILQDQDARSNEFQLTDRCSVLAKLFALDQMSEKPGNLKHEEIDFLVRRHYAPGSSYDTSLWLLYLVGRYYEQCGEQEKAMQSYRRLLGLRSSLANFPRCFAIERLRKAGLTKEEYLKAIMADAKGSRQYDSQTWPDRICRQVFREYSPSPRETMLAKPISPDATKNLAKNMTKILEVDTKEVETLKEQPYQATSLFFKGEEIPGNETFFRLTPFKSRDWYCSGIAFSENIPTKLGPQDAKEGFYPVLFGTEPDLLHARIYFYKDEGAVLVISLRKGKQPDSPFPALDSDCVRIEMEIVNQRR